VHERYRRQTTYRQTDRRTDDDITWTWVHVRLFSRVGVSHMLSLGAETQAANTSPVSLVTGKPDWLTKLTQISESNVEWSSNRIRRLIIVRRTCTPAILFWAWTGPSNFWRFGQIFWCIVYTVNGSPASGLYPLLYHSAQRERTEKYDLHLLICWLVFVPAQRRRLVRTGNGNQFVSYRVVIGVGV